MKKGNQTYSQNVETHVFIFSDLRGLVPSPTSTSLGDQYWIRHESMNILSNFFSIMEGKRDVFNLSSLFMKELWKSHHAIEQLELTESM